MGEKFAKIKDENKILIMLAFFSISIGNIVYAWNVSILFMILQLFFAYYMIYLRLNKARKKVSG